jgi:hypothetical protein
MIRAMLTALLCAAAIVTGDAVFRTSLLRQLRPVILSPSDQAVVSPPVQVAWEGPQRMQVLLSSAGAAQRDLGTRESPLTIDADQFPRDGGYEIELKAPRFGGWIHALRWFQVHAEPAVPPPPAAKAEPDGGTREAKDILHALEVARASRDRAQSRTRFLREENAALRDESQRLAKQLESLYKTQEEDAERQADLERRLTQLAEETRTLNDENAALRLRLGSVIPCTVWGYYNYPRPQTIPVTRRMLVVSDTRGQIFRAQIECEIVRRDDPTAASICFCAGSSFGG